MQAL
jgi:hypothetical protein